MHARRAPSAAIATLAALATVAAPLATAQFSGDVVVVSDYRYRGVSLSGNRPAAQAGVGFDARNGLYAGAFVSTLDAGFIEANALVQLYGGFAQRTGEWAWDAGAGVTAFPGDREYDFTEVHAGATWDKWNVTLHYAPDYFGRRVRAFYAELNGKWPFAEPFGLRMAFVAHAGALDARMPADLPIATRSQRFDAKAGVTFDAQWLKVELAWVAGDTPVAVYPVRRDSARHALVVSVSCAF